MWYNIAIMGGRGVEGGGSAAYQADSLMARLDVGADQLAAHRQEQAQHRATPIVIYDIGLHGGTQR
jgi:hypothetical protein